MNYVNAYKNYFNIATLLINSGANLNAKLPTTEHHYMLINTCILIIIIHDKDANELHEDVMKIAKLLIKGGANVNAVDNDKNSHHYAFKIDVVDGEPMRDNDIELAYILLEAGANLKLRNNDDETPYEVADVDDLTRFDTYFKKNKYAKKLTKKFVNNAMTNKVKKK